MSNRDRAQNPDKGKNFGQGLAGISDKDRRDLANANVTEKDHASRRADDSRPAGDGDRPQPSSSDQRR